MTGQIFGSKIKPHKLFWEHSLKSHKNEA